METALRVFITDPKHAAAKSHEPWGGRAKLDSEFALPGDNWSTCTGSAHNKDICHFKIKYFTTTRIDQ